MYGVDVSGLIKDIDGLYEATPLNIFGGRGAVRHVRADREDEKVRYSTILVEQ